MSCRKLIFIVPLLVVLGSPVHGAQGVLTLHVRDTTDRPVPGVEIEAAGPGSTARTNKGGTARLELATGTKPADWVTLQLRSGAEEDWVIISPWDRRVRVPPFEESERNVAPIVLGRREDRQLLESRDALTALAARILKEVRQREQQQGEIGDEQRQLILEEQAAEFGLEPEEVDRAIRDWVERTDDPFQKGLGALYEQNYPEAELQLRKSLGSARQKRVEAEQEVVNSARYLGEALRKQGKHKEAVIAYQVALEMRPKDPELLNALGFLVLNSQSPWGLPIRPEWLFWRARELNQARCRSEHVPMLLASVGRWVLTAWSQGGLPILRELSLQTVAAVHDILSAYSMIMCSPGDHQNAIETLQHIVSGLHEELGPEHPDTLIAEGYLTSAILNSATIGLVEAYAEEFENLQRELGPEHEDTLVAMRNVGFSRYVQGDLSGARDLQEKLFEICRRTLGEKHPDTLHAAHRLYTTLRDMNDKDAMTQLLEGFFCSIDLAEEEEISSEGYLTTRESLNRLCQRTG